MLDQDLVLLDWEDTSGSDRDLVKEILTRRVDRVSVVSRSKQRIGRFHSLGFPADASEPLVRLRPVHAVEGHLAPFQISSDLLSMPARLVESDPPFFILADELLDGDAGHERVRELMAAGGDVGVPVSSSLFPALLEQGYLQIEVLWTATLQPSLSTSVSPIFERNFQMTAADVDAYGQQSGDLNPLHFDDDFARAHGFEQRISHGMLFNGWLTRLLGMEYPGPGTIFLRNSASYHAPVYPGRDYRVRISTPRRDPQKGLMQVVAQLLDEMGQHCTLSYNELMSRPPKHIQLL